MISLITGALISIIKFTGYYYSDSSAVLSDALESLINVVAAAIAMFSIHYSNRGADKDHHFGHGKAEYFSAGAEGAMIMMAGALIFWESTRQLMEGHELRRIDVGLVMVMVAGFLNLILGIYLIRIGKKYHSKALVADGKHVLTDVYTSVGVLVALILVYLTGIPDIDPVVAILLGLWIIYSGFQILRESADNLMDRATPELLEEVTDAMAHSRLDEMIRPHRLRVRESGAGLMLDFHVILPHSLTVTQVHDIEVEFAYKLAKRLKRPVDLMMHTDPCIVEDCPVCSMQNCGDRMTEVNDEVDWTADLLIKDIHHPYEHPISDSFQPVDKE